MLMPVTDYMKRTRWIDVQDIVHMTRVVQGDIGLAYTEVQFITGEVLRVQDLPADIAAHGAGYIPRRHNNEI